MLRESNYKKDDINSDICIKINSRCKTIRKVKSKDLYWTLIQNRSDALVKPAGQLKWEKEFQIPKDSFKMIFKLPFNCCKYTKYQSFQYKIIHRIFPCNEWLSKMNIKASGQCSFCEQKDSIQHHLIQCPKTLLFWKMFYKWWNSLNVPRISDIDMTNILFGHPEKCKLTDVLNYVLLIAKYHIYKQKQNNSQPFLPLMLIELKNQLIVDEHINIKNGTRTKFIDEFDVVYSAL
jgi:hypothetical protein